MSQNYSLVCLSECMSLVTHMSHSEGNESLIACEEVATALGKASIPYLSGNAIRHRLVREPGMRWLVDQYGLAGKLSLPQLNFLFHGGALTQGTQAEDTRRIAEFQRLWPLGRLLGGCLPDQILAGSLQAWRGALVCEENRRYLAQLIPGVLFDGPLRSAQSFVTGWQYTRSGASKTVADLLPLTPQPNGNGDGDALMIYSGQGVVRGALFVHGFSLPHASEVELGALLWSLWLWQTGGGSIGGMAAKGHGRLRLSLVSSDIDLCHAVTVYTEYAQSVRDEAVAWLQSVFAPPKSASHTTARGRRGKTATQLAETPPESEPSLFGGDSDG